MVSDTRLRALARDESRDVFAALDAGPMTAQVRLLFRRAFADLMGRKKPKARRTS